MSNFCVIHILTEPSFSENKTSIDAYEFFKSSSLEWFQEIVKSTTVYQAWETVNKELAMYAGTLAEHEGFILL